MRLELVTCPDIEKDTKENKTEKKDKPVKNSTGKVISLAELKKNASARAEAAADKEFPPSRPAAIRGEIETLYQPFKLGEEITVHLLVGRLGPIVSGRFIARYPAHVRIGDRTILKADVTPLDRVRLDPDVCARRRREEIETRLRLFRERRERFRRRKFEEAYRAACAAAGYVLRDGEWRDPAELLEEALERRRQAEAEALRGRLEAKIFGAAGFVSVDGRWRPGDPDATGLP
jgi:hypothetical protein